MNYFVRQHSPSDSDLRSRQKREKLPSLYPAGTICSLPEIHREFSPRNLLKHKAQPPRSRDDCSTFPFVPEEMAAQFQQKLKMGDIVWQMITYGDVRHSFTSPAADKHGMEALKYDADADRRSWQAMQVFLQEVFAD